MSDETPLSVQHVRAVLARVHDTWEQVVCGTSVVTRHLRIAEVDVDVVIAGDEIAEILSPAFDGLDAARGPARGVVGAWDAAATGFGFPPRPTVPQAGPVRCLVRRDGRPIAELEWPTEHMLRTGDRDAGHHLLAVSSAAALSPWEAGAPLRRQLTWALGPEVLFVHAAAVCGPDGAALIMGPAGAGKSSTSLACLQAGMGFLSDDYCLVRGDPPVAYRLHATARVLDEDVTRFRGLPAPLAGTSLGRRNEDEKTKALYLLHDSFPERMVSSAPVRVVLVPDPRGERRPRLEPLRPAEALRELAPSALWQMSLEPDRELFGLRTLVSTVPCFRLVLSRDREANPPVVQEALAAACTLDRG